MCSFSFGKCRAAWLACARRLFSVALLAALGAACTPEFNWRLVQPDDSDAWIMLPARPDSMRRHINLDGLEVEMQMIGARAGGISYTLAWVALDDPAAAGRALAAMQAGMLRNIGAGSSQNQPRRVPLRTASGAAAGALDAIELRATGVRPAPDMQIRALFAARGDHVWQAVVLGPGLNDAQSDPFIESFVVRAIP